jgi:BMFP domain-containing protein YqiC
MLLASSLETREERLFQTIQQHIVGTFLPVLQRVSPAEGVGKARAEAMADPLKAATDAILNHVAQLAEQHIRKLGVVLEDQQVQVTSWGQGLQDQASSAAAVVKASLEDAAKNLRDSGSEFLARLDLVRQTWAEQSGLMQTALRNQTETNHTLTTKLQTAAEQQAEASQSLTSTLQSMQGALAASATAVQSLEAGLSKLADSPLERISTAMVKSLEEVGRESDKIMKTLAVLSDGTRNIAEIQTSVHAAVKQLDDAKLVETLDAFRKALTRHADVVDKLNSGLKLTLNV